MIRSAFLIVAHNNFEMLKFLIKSLDSEEHDIYIHIDKKCGDIDYSQFESLTKFSHVKCLRDRINVFWGGVSQIQSTLNTLETAILGGQVKQGYSYFHLISGVDFPLLSNKDLDDFLEKNKGKEFVGFTRNNQDLENKLGYYHLFNDGWMVKLIGSNRLHNFILQVQKSLHIRRYTNIASFAKGCNWWSITEKLAKALIANKDTFLKTYKYTLCCDEVFVQTFVKQHPEFASKLYNLDDEYEGCMRLIDWTRGTPYTYKESDFKELSESNRFFARKFDSIHVTKGFYKLKFKRND